jgi:LEA14-like dessication related protein
MKTCLRSVLILVAAAALGACALAPKLEAPRLTIVDVQVVSADLWQQRLKVRMHVENPNDRTMPIRGIEYALEVDGQQFATGVSATSFVIPALGEAEFDMNVNTNLAGTLIRFLARGQNAPAALDYHLTGKVSLSEGLLRSIPFDQRGSFKLQ